MCQLLTYFLRGYSVYSVKLLLPCFFRFSPAYSRLADKFWPQNIVIVTHGYGVDEAVKKGGGPRATFVGYCGYVELTRTDHNRDKWEITFSSNIEDVC